MRQILATVNSTWSRICLEPRVLDEDVDVVVFVALLLLFLLVFEVFLREVFFAEVFLRVGDARVVLTLRGSEPRRPSSIGKPVTSAHLASPA